ncbi:hypothetical protein FN846DRAFT_918759 [Sphaerosporella brunnea]|uniref:Uncharacterized protein n=1 Tax=Sphaerosporella brunnea TaxID=1250544 RepID=A0A5J5EYB0_9PEZI|nr:hypothetical protein FN846DRAFT_918759 [Sphaerosporella brunnea]
MMSLSSHTPQVLLDKLNDQSRELLNREAEPVEAFRSISEDKQYHQCLEISAHRREMRKHEELAVILDLREVVPLSFENLHNLVPPEVDKESVVFVEWIIPRDLRSSSQIKVHDMSETIQLVATRAGGIPDLRLWHPGGIETSSLGGWEGNDALQQLNTLVAPLAECRKPGDVLILCPTQVLHRIPLHALAVTGELLIQCNSVIRSPLHSSKPPANLLRSTPTA